MNTNKEQDPANYKTKIEENTKYSDYFMLNSIKTLCLPSFNGFSKDRETGVIDVETENQLRSYNNVNKVDMKKSTFYNQCESGFDFTQKNRNQDRNQDKLAEMETDHFNRRIVPFQYTSVNNFSFVNSRNREQ